MEPMKPMKPMKPMAPMSPMAPMTSAKTWWPTDLGDPSSSGSQGAMRYAFFPKAKRLIVEIDGKRKTYDSGDHQISGVAQQSSNSTSPTFTSQDGPIDLTSWHALD